MEITRIGKSKLVNLRNFYDRFRLPYHYYLYIDKCSNFSPLEKKIPVTKTLCLGYY